MPAVDDCDIILKGGAMVPLHGIVSLLMAVRTRIVNTMF